MAFAPPLSLPLLISSWLLSCLLCGWSPAVARGQSPATPSAPANGAERGAPASSSESLEVALGFEGKWKLGHVCPVLVQVPDSIAQQAAEIQLQTVDGDGVQVTYRQSLETPGAGGSAGGAPNSYWVPIRMGRREAPLTTRIFDTAGELLAEQALEPDPRDVLDSDQPFLLAVGSAMGVEQLNRRSADGSRSTFTTQVMDRAERLPPNWYDYSGCDLVLISTADPELLSGIGGAWRGIEQWIQRGGNCIISLDADSIESLESLPPLLDLLPGSPIGTGRIDNPGVLESLVATDDPLQRFSAVLVEPARGQVELSFTDSLAKTVPWWIRYAHGHGSVQMIATDLDTPAFADWEDRKQLWERLIRPYFDQLTLDGTFSAKQISDSSYLGYNDIVGQLRATLDVFPERTVISFGQVAALLIGIVLLIGPVDYLVSVRWLKRPDLSWYLAGTILVLACTALSWLYASLRPDRMRINTAQILDIDLASGTLNGHLWAHVYSGSAQVVDIELQQARTAGLRFLEQEHPERFVDWQGLPGSGLGGLDSQLNTSRGMPAYAIDVGRPQPAVRGVGIAPAGTKGVAAEWRSVVDIQQQANLSELSGVDQLSGEFTNPFDVDIKDAYLMYHNWYYRLNSRIPAGSRVSITSETIPKDIARKLNERTGVGNTPGGSKWDPADRDSIDRLLEMMMFYDAATGRKYTSLAHRFQPLLDQSNLLESKQAILVGRLDDPQMQLSVKPVDAVQTELMRDLDRVWCRLVIPVK